jgi:trigger factor
MEVWPEFTLPPYKGLKLRRPVFPISDELVDKFIEYRFRHLASRVERREQAEPGDLVIGTLEIRRNGEKVAEIPDVRLVCQSELHFRDGVVKNFLEVITGARPGEVRHFTIELSPREGSEGVPATAEASLRVEDVCHVYPAESLDDVLQALGLQSMDQLRELARQMLAQRIEALQAHFLHQQVMRQWVQQVHVDLPPRLLQQLHIRTLRRRVEELLQMGYSPDEINRHSQILIRDALSVAAGDIVAQMLVQKIADQENIEITEEDLQKGIERLAEELGETPRRLRARLEREGRLEDLAMALLSQRVMQLIYQQADIEDVPAGEIAPEDLFDPDRLPSLHRRLEEQLFGQPAATPQIIVPPGTETSTSAEAAATSDTGSSSSSGEAATSAETPPAEDRPTS